MLKGSKKKASSIAQLKKRVAQLEEELHKRTLLTPTALREGVSRNFISVEGIDLEWNTTTGQFTFRGLPVAMMWVDSTLAGVMAGVAAMVGPERFSLALQAEGRKGVESDWMLIAQYDDFLSGFDALHLNAAVAGWGDWQLIHLDMEKPECLFRAYNNWEGMYQKSLGVCWGSGMLAGKFAGICSKLFKTNCWAGQTRFVAKGDPYDEFIVTPSDRNLEQEIEGLLATDAATRADMAVALTQLHKNQTLLHQREEALAQTEKRFRAVFEESPLPMQIFAKDGTTLHVNRAWEKMWGVDLAWLNKIGYNVLHDRELESHGVQKDVARAFAGEPLEIGPIAYDRARASGGEKSGTLWVRTSIYPVRDLQEAVSEVILVHEDITQRQQDQQALLESEERFRTLFESAADAIFLADPITGMVLEANNAAALLLGKPVETIQGLHQSQLHPPEITVEIQDAFQAHAQRPANAPGTPFVSAVQHADGRIIPVEITGTLISIGGKNLLQGIFRDITERQRIDDLIRQTNEDLERRVAEQTAELRATIQETERFNRLAVDRELRMIELKGQVNDLMQELDRPPPFSSDYRLAGTVAKEDRDPLPLPPSGKSSRIGGVPFKELLDFGQLKQLMDYFCQVVGIASAIIDLEGNIIIASRWQRLCTGFHRVNPQSCARCIESDTDLALRLHVGEQFALYNCKNGLTDAASPILVEGQHVANVFVGQFLLHEADRPFFSQQARELGFPLEDYLAALDQVPIIPQSHLPAILGFLTGFAQLVALLSLERKQALDTQRIMRQEREAALSLAEDAEQARAEKARYQLHLEVMVQERTAQLSRSQKLLQLVLDTIPAGVFWKDRHGIYLGGNRLWARDAGLGDPQNALGRTDYEMVWREMADAYRQDDLRVIESGQARLHYEEPSIAPDGQRVWVRTSKMPLTDENNQIIGVLGTYEDITQQKQDEEKMIRAKEAAEAANRTKSEFLAAMSHEIRTPMNVVIGMGDVLMETPLQEEQRSYVRKLQEAGNNLLELINQILELSKIEAGQLQLQEEPVQIAVLLQEIADLLRVMAAGKGLMLACQVDGTVPLWIQSDRLRLRQILFNLLGNAVKFTERGEVILRGGTMGQTPPLLHLQVEDTGIGIGQEHLESIFDSFTQADSSVTRRYGGTGLGLSISRRLVELMGGRIWVESHPGSGTVFHVTLPLRIAEPPPPLREIPLLATITDVAGPALRILLVEDAEENQLLFTTYLKKMPHQVEIAVNGEEAVRRVRQSTFDLLFMDVQMPIMDGYTATRLIRQWETESGSHHLPIIALTAHALEGEAERSKEAGCDLYLSKPLRKQRLLDLIQQIGLEIGTGWRD